MHSLLNKIKRVSHALRRLCGASCVDGVHAEIGTAKLHAETSKPVRARFGIIKGRSNGITSAEAIAKWKELNRA